MGISKADASGNMRPFGFVVLFTFCYILYLMTFLEGITNLTSLQKLEIGTCPNLTSLPDPCLKSLNSLRFYNCTLLEEKYKREIGEDWHKVAHIPDFSTGFW